MFKIFQHENLAVSGCVFVSSFQTHPVRGSCNVACAHVQNSPHVCIPLCSFLSIYPVQALYACRIRHVAVSLDTERLTHNMSGATWLLMHQVHDTYGVEITYTRRHLVVSCIDHTYQHSLRCWYGFSITSSIANAASIPLWKFYAHAKFILNHALIKLIARTMCIRISYR